MITLNKYISFAYSQFPVSKAKCKSKSESRKVYNKVKTISKSL